MRQADGLLLQCRPACGAPAAQQTRVAPSHPLLSAVPCARRACACMQVIQLQGDQRKNVLQFLTQEKLVKKEFIKIHGF